jgi:hypothetical protein
MRARWLALALAWLLLAPVAYAQDAALKDAIGMQQRRADVLSEADLQRRLNRKLIQLAKQFWLAAKADGLKFEDVVQNIGLRNAAMEDFGLPLQVIRREDTDEFAVTSRTGESVPRAWVAISGSSPDTGIDLTAIDGAIVSGPALTEAGGIDTACRYRVVFANGGEHDERGHDDYAHEYPCIQFLIGELDAVVVADLTRWAVDLIRRDGR